MKKILSIGLLFGALFFFSFNASAQNDHEKKIWEDAQAKTTQVADKLSLTDNQKAYVTRHLYNYQARLEALNSNSDYQPFESKTEIKNLFDKEMQDALSSEQYTKFKQYEEELLKK